MSTFFQEALQKTRASFDRRVAELAEANPKMKIAEMAQTLSCSTFALQTSFRRQGINRRTGRPPKRK